MANISFQISTVLIQRIHCLCCTVLITALSLLIRSGDYWRVSTKVEGWGFNLIAKVGEADHMLPPVKGWEFYDGGKWVSDPTMECSREQSPACSEVIVELTGEALKKIPMCVGRYLPVEGKIIRGRPVGSFEKHLNNDLVVGSQFAIGFIINDHCYGTNSNIIIIRNVIVFSLFTIIKS